MEISQGQLPLQIPTFVIAGQDKLNLQHFGIICNLSTHSQDSLNQIINLEKI